MNEKLKLTEKDIAKYKLEIDNINLDERIDTLNRAMIKINDLLTNPQLDQIQLALVQEIKVLFNVLNTSSNLETSVQQKIIFALKYFLKENDDIPDNIGNIGLIDDLAVVDWIIQEIKDQYSHYFQA